MLSFITYKDAPEQLEIVADSKGVNELVDYLLSIKKGKDHMHLSIGTELDEYPITGPRVGKTISAKHVRLEYEDTSSWNLSEK